MNRTKKTNETTAPHQQSTATTTTTTMETDEKTKKYRKQMKRMGKLLRTIWDLSEPIFQTGMGDDDTDDVDFGNNNDNNNHTTTMTTTTIRYLTNVGEQLDAPTTVSSSSSNNNNNNNNNNGNTSYHKVGRHGWEYFAKDIVHVYHRHIHRKGKYATVAQKHINTIKELFRDIHPDLETTITEYCNHYPNDHTTTGADHNAVGNGSTASSSAKRTKQPQQSQQSTSTAATPNSKEQQQQHHHHHDSNSGGGGGGEYAEKESKYLEALHTYIQELEPNQDMKKVKQLLHGYRCRVVKNGTSRYDVSYFNSQNRKFRSRVEIGRFLQLVAVVQEEEDDDDDDGRETEGHHGKKRPTSAAASSSSLTATTTTTTPLMKRRRMNPTSHKQSVKIDAEKKRIRQEIDKLRKSLHRATRNLDDYLSSSTNSTTNATAAMTPNNQHHHHHCITAEYPMDDRLLLSLNDNHETTTATTTSDSSGSKIDQSILLQSRKPDRIQFPNIPIACTPEVIMTWDFLSTFHRALSLSPIELDDFVHAISYVPPYGQVGDDVVTPPVYIVEAHLAILKLLLQDKSSDEWWWSILETEVVQQQENGTGRADDTIGDDDDDDVGVGNSKDVVYKKNRPVIRIDIKAALAEVEDPLITNSWLTTLEKCLDDKNIAVKRKTKVTNAIRTCLKLVSNKWIAAYLRKALTVGKVNGSIQTLQAVRWLVHNIRAARPDLGERGVSSNTIQIAREKIIQDVEQQMESLGATAPAVTDVDLAEADDDDDESDDESDDDEDNGMVDGSQHTYNGESCGNDSEHERPASVIPPKPLPTLVDLLLPPNKPQSNSEFVDAFSWSHIAGATAIRVLHRKKRLLNESDDAIRAANARPRLTISDRREREILAASRLLTEVENSEESILETASLFLSNGGSYLDLSPQERLCILRVLIEAAYDTARVYDVVSGNYKQWTGAMKALEVEQRRSKREAKEKIAKDESSARQRLADDVRERFLNEQREEIRKLNDKSKEFADDVIESLTDEDIIEFDDDIKADFEALPGPESFTKIEVSQMISKLLEELAFETHDLQVMTLSELMEKEKREFEELEGRYTGFGGDLALDDDSLDRETIRTLQGLRREVERARTSTQTLPDLRSNALAQLKDALDDGRIKVLRTAYNVAKKARLVGSNDETGGVWALDLMRDAALELEKAKQNKRVLDAQKDLVAKRNKCFIRTEPMGRDRYGTRFWSFGKKSDDGDGDDGTVWVETEFRLQNTKTVEEAIVPSELDDLARDPEKVFIGAPDMEDDFTPKDHQDKFIFFSRCEYHSSGVSANLALHHWGCHATEESLRSLIKSLDSRGIRENDLKSKLKEILEETLGSGESEKADLLVPRSSDDVDAVDTEVDRIRYDGDEAAFIEAKDDANGVDNVDTEAFDEFYSGLLLNVRIRQVVDSQKDPPVARYENGRTDAWKLCVRESDDEADSNGDKSTAAAIEYPMWRVIFERGRIIWLTGQELLESLTRYTKWKQGKGYFENDAAFFLYRNTLGKFCGKNSEAAYAASPYYFAKVMLKKEAELYPKLKTRNMENSWGGQSGARSMWTNSMKDYAYDFQTVKQGLLTLENALFELTGSFNDYTVMDVVDEQSIDVAALLKDPVTAFDIELESIEKDLPGLWNTPKVRAAFIYIVEKSATTGFLALALDLLCRNTVKYLQTHNLLNARGGGTASSEYPNNTSSSLYNNNLPSSRATRRMNAWQQKQQQKGVYY